MSVSLKRRPKKNRVPHVAKLRETVRTGPAAEFYTDGGPTMSLSRIAALPDPEWARPAYGSRHGLPLGWLRRVDMVAVAASRATLAENLAAIGDEFGRLGRHTVRMAVTPVAAQLDEPLPGTNWAADLNAVLPPRVTPTPQETAMPRQWYDDITDDERAAAQAAAAQRAATLASWTSETTDGDPRPIGMDPFHEPDNPKCGCTQCLIAAAVAPKAEPVTASTSAPVTVAAADELWPFLYSPAQLDGTACARCGKEFAVNEPNRPVVTDECNEQFVHSDRAQCGPAVPPWNDADETGTEAAR